MAFSILLSLNFQVFIFLGEGIDLVLQLFDEFLIIKNLSLIVDGSIILLSLLLPAASLFLNLYLMYFALILTL
jgi:hypothetical protein